MKFKYLKFAFSLIIVVVLIFSLKDVDWKLAFRRLDLSYIPFILSLLIFSLFLRAWRWQILMNDGNNAKTSLKYSIKLLFIGQALNIIMPSGAGEVAKSYFGYKDTGIKERMFAVSLYDKIMAISSIGFLGFYSFYNTENSNYLLLSILVFLPFVILANINIFRKNRIVIKIILFFSAKIKKIDIENLLINFNFTAVSNLYALLISVFAWILTYLMLYFCFLTFTNSIEIEKVFIHSPIITIARLFPFTLNGIGTDEALMMFLFSEKSFNENLLPLILLGTFYYRLISVFVPAIIGLIIIQKK